MVGKKVIIDNLVSFLENKMSEMASNNPFILVFRPIISRAINNNIEKVDSILKIVQDKNGMVDIDNILSEMIDNLLIANVKKYPNVFGGIEIGNGSVKIGIPFIDKAIVFDSNDIKDFKQLLINK